MVNHKTLLSKAPHTLANDLVTNVDLRGFNLRKSHHSFNLILGASPPFLSMSRQASSPKPYARSYSKNTSPFGRVAALLPQVCVIGQEPVQSLPRLFQVGKSRRVGYAPVAS